MVINFFMLCLFSSILMYEIINDYRVVQIILFTERIKMESNKYYFYLIILSKGDEKPIQQCVISI